MKLPTTLRSAAFAALAAASLVGVAGCAPQTSSAVYTTGHNMQASQVQFGKIVDARSVEMRHMQRGDQAAGVVLGGALGALAGDQFGKGNGNTLMTGAGAIAGAALGNNVAQRANRHQATEWFVRLDSGATIAVVQNDPSLYVGANVKVITDGTNTRIVR